MNQPNFDLDKFVDMRSISRCGRKFNPENLLPRSEITKLRPVVLHQQQQMFRLMQQQILKESDKILDSKANTKEANRILQEINQLKVNKEHGAKDQISKVEQHTKQYQMDQILDTDLHSSFINETDNKLTKSKQLKSWSINRGGQQNKSSSFMAISRMKRDQTFVYTRDASPPPGNYIPKYGFVMKRPQTNMFTKSQRFKDLNFQDGTFDHSQQLSLINQSLMNNPANRSQLSRSIVKHERTVVTQSNLENSIDLINQSKSRELSPAKKHLILQNKSQVYENYLTQSVGGVSTMVRSRPLLCVSFDKQVARKQLIDGYQSPHEERFKYRSFIQSKLQDLSFDKQTIRKNEALNSGATCLDYDYSKTLDKVKFDSTIQKVQGQEELFQEYDYYYYLMLLNGNQYWGLAIPEILIRCFLTFRSDTSKYDNQNKVDKK